MFCYVSFVAPFLLKSNLYLYSLDERKILFLERVLLFCYFCSILLDVLSHVSCILCLKSGTQVFEVTTVFVWA